MLKYLIIQLDDASTSYCYYAVNKDKRFLMPMDVLKSGIIFAMKENLMVQYLLPDYKLPDEYINVMESVDNCKIASFSSSYASISDVLVIDKWKEKMSFVDNKTYKQNPNDYSGSISDTSKFIRIAITGKENRKKVVDR